MDVSVTPVGSCGVNLDLELGDLCAQIGCCREPAVMSWVLGVQGGTGQTFPNSEPFLLIGVRQSHQAVQL